jgi:hypothetical protein
VAADAAGAVRVTAGRVGVGWAEGGGVSTIATNCVGSGVTSVTACSAEPRRTSVVPTMPMLASSNSSARPNVSIVERGNPPRFSR